MEGGAIYDKNMLVEGAKYSWLQTPMVLYILNNYQNFSCIQISTAPVQRPGSGTLALFDKRVVKHFRCDGHNWKKKKNSNALNESHSNLSHNNRAVIYSCYIRSDDNPNFQRRCYWKLDVQHIVLVHYRDITVQNPIAGAISQNQQAASSSNDSPATLPSPSQEDFNYLKMVLLGYEVDILEFAPKWGYSDRITEITFKLSFADCVNPSTQWWCKLGSVVVPMSMTEEDIYSCHVPPSPCFSGKVALLITRFNEEVCSDEKEFEYRLP